MKLPPSRARAIYVLPLALPMLFYLMLPTKNFYWDGVGIAIDIEKRGPLSSLIYPSHLAFAPWGSGLYKLSGLLGIHTRALFAMQTANGILAGICVFLVYRAVRLAGATTGCSVLAALVFGFSATWWRFATDANAYVPSICLLLCAYLLIMEQKPAVLAGLVFAGAMLFHELAILFLPVALVMFRKNRRAMSVFLAASLAPTAVAYWFAYRTVSPVGDVTGFPAWITVHSPDSAFSFRPWTDFIYTIRGTLRLFFGGRLADIVPGPLSKLALIAFAIALLGFLHFAWRARRRAGIAALPRELVIWIGVYVAFLFFWMPQNTFYRLFYLAPLIAVLALATRHTPEIHAAGCLFAAALFLWNFTFVTYPQSQVAFNAPLRFALTQRGQWPAGTPIVFHDFNADLWTISYFNPQTAWIGVDRLDLAQLDHDVEYARRQNQALWMEGSAYALISSRPEGQRWLATHERPGELIRFRDDKHEFRFYCAR